MPKERLPVITKDLKQNIVYELEPAKHDKGKYVCPLCGSGTGRNRTAACVLNDNFTIHCFSCGFHGDIIDLYAAQHGTDKKDAIKAVMQKYVRDGAGENWQPVQPKVRKNYEADEGKETMQEDYGEYIKQCAAALKGSPGEKYMAQRGFTEETLQRFNIGYDEKLGAVIIPYPGENYYISRSITEKKYRKPKGTEEPIFNAAALGADKLFIVEGQLDALSIIQCGGEAAAIGGSGFRKLEEMTIKGRVFILADNDAAGERTAQNIKAALEDKGTRVRIVRIDTGYNVKDANDLLRINPEELKLIAADPDKHEYSKNSAALYAAELLNSERAATPAISTGFPKLDEALGGGIYEGLYVVGAVSSLGKTTFALQLADQIADSGKDILFFSLEMQREELIAKSVSRWTLTLAGKKTSNAKTTRGITDPARRRRYSEEEQELLANAIARYGEYGKHIWIDEGLGNIGTQQIEERIEDHIRITGNTPIVFIDYLQILASPDPRMTDKQATDKNVFNLKRISRKYKLPIVAVSSLNRDNYTAAVNMAAFKESGAIEYSSDVLIGLQPQGMKDGSSDSTRTANASTMRECKTGSARNIELAVLKNRHGTAYATVNYEYAPAFNVFKEN